MYITIREGSTDILVPEVHSSGGPGKRTGDVFFNEQMAFNRDVSVMLLKALDRQMDVADAMSATGARAVRIANEVPSVTVTANDRDPKATELISRNIELNGLTNCTAVNKDLGSLFSEHQFDYVDIDPFGSPMPFLHSAIRGCRRNGILAVTATDTAPLAGANHAKCRRRYGSMPYKGLMCHDTGLRILMASLAKELAKFDRGMSPILSFYADHYFRTYVRLTEGAKNADDTLSELIYLNFDFEKGRAADLRRLTEREPGMFSSSVKADGRHRPIVPFGPFWGGNLHDKEILKKMDPSGMADEKRCGKMLDLWINELDHVPFPYDISEISSFLKVSPPKMDVLLETLNEYGSVSRSHMSPTLFNTDADNDDVMEAFRIASARKR